MSGFEPRELLLRTGALPISQLSHKIPFSIFVMFQDCRLRELPRQDICELARLWRCPLGKKYEKDKESPSPLAGKKKEIFWGKSSQKIMRFFMYFFVCRVAPLILCENI